MKGTWRQQQARQAMLDGLSDTGADHDDATVISNAARDAVEVATTVKITQDALDALFSTANGGEFATREDVVAGLTAALEALGFEVVQ